MFDNVCVFFFFFNDTATTEIYTLSLHDALPIFMTPVSFRIRARTPAEDASFGDVARDRKSTRLNSSHLVISYAVFCLKKKNNPIALISGLTAPLLTLLPLSAGLIATHYFFSFAA